MANTYFQFKQFIIHQDQCAMKVCTDACLFGAWVAETIISSLQHKILDVGSGSGLLSLMLAQKLSGPVDAVEIETDAAQQAHQNFATSPWSDRITLHHCDIKNFNLNNPSDDLLYNLIISNPPFFSHSLKSADKQKNLAKHVIDLSYQQLSEQVRRLLHIDGCFFILLPYHSFEEFKNIADSHGLYLHQQVNVRQTPKHTYFRTIAGFRKQIANKKIECSEITIKTNEHFYSDGFISLLKDYYLHL